MNEETLIAFATGGWKLMFGVVFTNILAGGVTLLIAKKRGINTQMLVFLSVLFFLGGIVQVL